MAKKRKSRRPSMLTKAINIGILALAFKRPIELAIAGNFNGIIEGATLGFGTGSPTFAKEAALQFYGPMVAAVVLKKVISMVRRTARV